MQTLAIILLLLSVLGGGACLVMLIISLLNKNFKFRPKKILIMWGGCLAIFIFSTIIGVATSPTNKDSKTTVKAESEVKEQPKEKTEEEKAADEAKKKADEEAKAKADADAKKAKEEADAKVAAEKAAKEQEEKIGYDTGITYDQLARTPDDYKGKKAKFSGKVIQVMEGDNETDLRIAVGDNYDNILFVAYKSEITSTRILENDYVTVSGKSAGIYKYKSTMGGQISVPSMLVDKIELNK